MRVTQKKRRKKRNPVQFSLINAIGIGIGNFKVEVGLELVGV